MNSQINNLVTYWKDQGIKIANGKKEIEITSFEEDNGILFPLEFRQYLSRVNGMEFSYPNEGDSNGFLFYPLENLELYKNPFKENMSNSVLIFADYLHRSWWYGLIIKANVNEASIVLLPTLNCNNYQFITNSFLEFIEFYMLNSEKIYIN